VVVSGVARGRRWTCHVWRGVAQKNRYTGRQKWAGRRGTPTRECANRRRDNRRDAVVSS